MIFSLCLLEARLVLHDLLAACPLLQADLSQSKPLLDTAHSALTKQSPDDEPTTRRTIALKVQRLGARQGYPGTSRLDDRPCQCFRPRSLSFRADVPRLALAWPSLGPLRPPRPDDISKRCIGRGISFTLHVRWPSLRRGATARHDGMVLASYHLSTAGRSWPARPPCRCCRDASLIRLCSRQLRPRPGGHARLSHRHPGLLPTLVRYISQYCGSSPAHMGYS